VRANPSNRLMLSALRSSSSRAALRSFASNPVILPAGRTLSTAFTDSLPDYGTVRVRFAEPSQGHVDVGFTDGSSWRFDSSWLSRAVSGPKPSAAAISGAKLDGESVTFTVGDAAATVDGSVLRTYADEGGVDLGPPSLLEPIRGPAVWTGAELADSPWWGHHLSEAEIDDLVSATKHAMQTVRWRDASCTVPEPLSLEEFPLGQPMANKLASLADELEYGKGLAMIRNMPTSHPALDEQSLAVMYVGLSAHIGHVVMQSSSGLRSVSRGYGMPLGRIQAEMTGETPKGGLQTNNAFRLHTDRCDVISLMSLRAAPSGGASRLASAPAIFNALLERAPHLAAVLAQPIDRIWEGENGYFRLPVVGLTPSGQFTTQFSPSYVENAQFLEDTVKATPEQIAALDAIEEIGLELGAEFVMQPGMLFFLNNHQVYHGRGNWSVTDSEKTGDWGNSGRLLFRTWISPYNSRPLPDTDQYRTVWGTVAGGALRGGWDQAIKSGEVPKPKFPDDHVYYSLFDDRVQQLSMTTTCATVLRY